LTLRGEFAPRHAGHSGQHTDFPPVALAAAVAAVAECNGVSLSLRRKDEKGKEMGSV